MELRSNKQIELAREFIYSTGANIFLTGRAGTGKTTFLRNALGGLHKRAVVAAPTGVAAINAGGVTLHSLFQLPFSPHIPGATHNPERGFRFRMGKNKIALIRSIELLVIDEISMVRCDVLDAIDQTLRRVRRSVKPFGGVQLLMIGDVGQLSPICVDGEWDMLREHYPTPYFFESHALRECGYVTIELQEIFRQSEPHFTSLLNAIRDNAITHDVLNELNKRYIPHFSPPTTQRYITLSTHNHSANRINTQRLLDINSESKIFKATIKGDYPSSAYPNDTELELKVGAQVIFIKNDLSPDKLYYNGLIGEITDIKGSGVSVQPNNGGKPITVAEVAWESIEYSIDESSGEIREEVKGSFKQLPLRCAWAITIHKSQGLSFDHAIIDASSSFAHGQVYVALSRCRTLEGMVLSSPLTLGAVVKDGNVEEFNQYITDNQPATDDLHRHQRAYLCTTLCEVFNLSGLQQHLSAIVKLLGGHLYMERPELCRAFAEALHTIDDECIKFSKGFCRQIVDIVSSSKEDTLLHERLKKASLYFHPRLVPITPLLEELREIKPDAKELHKRLKEGYEALREEHIVKLSAIKLCEEGFSVESYQRIKVESITQTLRGEQKGGRSKGKESHDIIHQELYDTLINWRSAEAKDRGVPAYVVMTNRAIIEIQARLPQNIGELKSISGIGTVKTKQYGEDIITIVKDFCYDNNI